MYVSLTCQRHPASSTCELLLSRYFPGLALESQTPTSWAKEKHIGFTSEIGQLQLDLSSITEISTLPLHSLPLSSPCWGTEKTKPRPTHAPHADSTQWKAAVIRTPNFCLSVCRISREGSDERSPASMTCHTLRVLVMCFPLLEKIPCPKATRGGKALFPFIPHLTLHH